MNHTYARGAHDFWFCIPEEDVRNEYAIYFAITDNYSFAVANMIMGLKKHSAQLMEKCDILIYHDGLSETNERLISTLHKDIFFMPVAYPKSWEQLFYHKNTMAWGPINICKYFGFMLINRYKKVLFLDADMCIRHDISELFEIEEAMAWRNVLAWKATDNFSSILKNDKDYISAGNAGLYLFTEKLRPFLISEDDIVKAFEQIKDLKRGGNDERIVAWIAYDKKATVKELDVKIWNTPVQRMTQDTKLVHFLDYVHTSTKPWKNLAAFLYFKEWADNYQTWINMGGEGLVSFTHEDYYQLFSFEKLKKLEKQEKIIKSNTQEIAEWKQNFNRVINSNSWKITSPLRKIKKKLSRIFRRMKG